MFENIQLIDFESYRPSDYCYGQDLETIDDFAAYFAVIMQNTCKYTVFKGEKNCMYIFSSGDMFCEDRDHYFIDINLISFLNEFDAPDEMKQHKLRVKIRNMALKNLTVFLKKV